eukprot:152654-Alexandrium_andersonii.AAC.1
MVNHSATKKAEAMRPALRILKRWSEGQAPTPEVLDLLRQYGRLFDWDVSDSTVKSLKGGH